MRPVSGICGHACTEGGDDGGVERRLQMAHRAGAVSSFQQEKGETVMRACELGRRLERTSVRPDRLLQATRARVRDGDVLQDLGIVGMIAQREPIGGERRVEVALPLEREGLAQVVNTSRTALVSLIYSRPATNGLNWMSVIVDQRWGR